MHLRIALEEDFLMEASLNEGSLVSVAERPHCPGHRGPLVLKAVATAVPLPTISIDEEQPTVTWVTCDIALLCRPNGTVAGRAAMSRIKPYNS